MSASDIGIFSEGATSEIYEDINYVDELPDNFNYVENTGAKLAHLNEDKGEEVREAGTNIRVRQHVEHPEDEDFEMKESGKLLKKYMLREGFGDHHVEMFDHWISRSAASNIYSRYLTFNDESVVVFENLRVFDPQFSRGGKVYRLTPKYAREQGVTYGSDWYVDVVHKNPETGHVYGRINNVCIGNVPVMLKSENCILRGKTPRQLALLGEEPNDPAGYFIVEGVEKTVMLQEQLAVNRIFLMKMDSKSDAVARMTANTPRGTALIELGLGKEKHNDRILELRFPSLKDVTEGEKYKSINVLRVFRLMGLVTFEDIKELLAMFIKPEYVTKSLLELNNNEVDFEVFPDDLAIIGSMLKPPVEDKDVIRERFDQIIEKDLFPHLNTLPGVDGESIQERVERINKSKMYLLAIMTARYLEHLAGYRGLDDRDSWSNKRCEGPGRLMEQLLRTAWRKQLGQIQGWITSGQINTVKGVVEKLGESSITESFRDSFIGPKWGVKGNQMKNNVAQTLQRDSVPATMAHINTIDVNVSRTDKQANLRLVQNSQWGLVDPVYASESANCGILKNICMTPKVSLDRSEKEPEIIRYLIGDREKHLEPRVSLDPSVRGEWPNVLFINGKFLGWCDAESTREFLLRAKRSGKLPYDMSVILEDTSLYIDIGPSRVIRPLLIVDEDQQLVIDKLNMRNSSTHDLMSSGAMEYISSWEQEYIKVASTVENIQKRLNKIRDAEQSYQVQVDIHTRLRRGELVLDETGNQLTENDAIKRMESAKIELDKVKKSQPYTHCEIDPKAMMGIVAGLIPWPNHNQAPRNTYQIAMAKQALGIYHSNHLNRFDGKMKTLAYSSRPIVETEMHQIIGLNDKGPGENVTVAFLSYPFTEEDAFIFKKEFLENGGFRICKYFTYKTIVRKSGDIMETLAKPKRKDGEDKDRYRFIQSGGKDSPVNGLPKIGAFLRQGDCVIGKVQYIKATNEYRNESVFLRVGDEGIVDKINIATHGQTDVVTVKLLITRIPQEGDKFAPRYAQKGTIGLVMSDIDMPFNDQGITPDIIVNPSCFDPKTPVTLKNGMARPLISLQYDGGDKVWSWNENTNKLVLSETVGYESKGVREVLELTLSDGRTLRCTPEHKIPVVQFIDGEHQVRTVRFHQLDYSMYFMAGIEGIIDDPTQDETTHEKQWKLETSSFRFNMKTYQNRDRALAFARLLGFISADRSRVLSNNSGIINFPTHIDADIFLDDLELVTKQRPTVTKNEPVKTSSIVLPKTFTEALSELYDTQQLPSFLFDRSSPKSFVREFIAGLFGATGSSPYLMTNKHDGHRSVVFNPPAISESHHADKSDELVDKMQKIADLLYYIGVQGIRVEKPKKYNNPDGTKMVSCTVQLSTGTEFGDKVGFRYSLQKQYRLAAYQSYMRYLDNVKRQNNFITKKTSELYQTTKLHSKSLDVPLEIARKELFEIEKPFNEYYSNATRDQVKNRSRLFTQLTRWDYSKIEDAEAYLRKIGVYHWFKHEHGSPDFFIKHDETQLPTFLLKFHSIRSIGKIEVFDIGVSKTQSLIGAGLAVRQCIPSRMTLTYFLELMASKHGAYRGKHINGSAFEEFAMDEYRQTHAEYGTLIRGEQGMAEGIDDETGINYFHFSYEKMKSGNSGKDLETFVNMGPVFFQALRHHVKDKAQVRGRGPVKQDTHQPPKGKGNQGGLKFGEMERDSIISHGATAFLRERLMKASDGYETTYCKNCGEFAVNDKTGNKFYPCRICEQSSFGRIMIPYAYKLLVNLLAPIGLNLRPEFISSEEYADKLFKNGPDDSEEVDLDELQEDIIADQAETEQTELNDEDDYDGFYD